MKNEQERAEFEAFVSKHGLCVTEDGDLYRSNVVAWMWKSWQAALQSQDREDAERYRWLRDDNAYFPEENYIRGGQELDAAIDAEMEQQK